MRKLASQYTRFFVDTSALTLPSRAAVLWRLPGFPEVRGRLLFGTDYPLPVFAYPCLGSFAAWRRARAAATRFDRHAEVLAAFGLEPTVDFTDLPR